MFWLLVRENLRHRPARTVLGVLLIAAPVALLLFLGGFHPVAKSTSTPVCRLPLNMWLAASAVHCFAVVLLTMHAAVMQRTRDLGVLRALGATKLFLLKLILAEALLLSFAGVVTGIALSSGAGALLTTALPERLRWIAVWESWLPVAGIVMGSAALGCLIPALAAIRMEVVDALDQD